MGCLHRRLRRRVYEIGGCGSRSVLKPLASGIVQNVFIFVRHLPKPREFELLAFHPESTSTKLLAGSPVLPGVVRLNSLLLHKCFEISVAFSFPFRIRVRELQDQLHQARGQARGESTLNGRHYCEVAGGTLGCHFERDIGWANKITQR